MTYYKITSDGETLCLTCGEMNEGVLINDEERGEKLSCDRHDGEKVGK